MGIGYRLGKWTVRPHRNRIERGSESVHLEPKAMAVLDCLARASNSVVTRQEILDSVWSSAAVSDEVLTQRIAEIRKAFGDSARQPNVIETIPKIGFRLIPTVVPLSEESASSQDLQQISGSRQGLKRLVFVAVSLFLVVLSLNFFWPGNPANLELPTNAENPVIAVLPFVNMSEDPGNEYFSDGISEELINLLATVPGLHVISRSSSFSFKGERMKIADIADELNASLIVEGTVRKFDNRVRITAQLIDPATDKHLLSESYDRELSDIFSLQGDIAQSIVNSMQDQIGPHKVIVERSTENIEAYELFFQGRNYFYQRGPALDNAITLLQMAVEEDPGFAEAWAYLAAVGNITCFYPTSISDKDAWALAGQASARALALNPNLGLALASQAMLAYEADRDLNRGFHLINRAADEYPQDSIVRLWAGMYHWYWGYLDEAQSHFQSAYVNDPRVGVVNGNLGLLYLVQGREDLATPHLEKATELGYPNHHQPLASRLMRRGDIEAAFAKLKITFTGPGTSPDRVAWVYELEAVGRSYIENPASADALISVLENAPRLKPSEGAWLALLFDLKDTFFEYLPLAVKADPLWLPYVVPTIWMPEYRSYIEDPRYFEIMRKDGAVEVWEQRGYLDGCVRVNDPGGDRLDCSRRYQ